MPASADIFTLKRLFGDFFIMKKPSGTTCDSATKSAWSRDKHPCTDNRQVSWLMGPRYLRTLQAAFPAIASDRAYAHCFKLPNHSDGFVQESHLFLFYPDSEDQAPIILILMLSEMTDICFIIALLS